MTILDRIRALCEEQQWSFREDRTVMWMRSLDGSRMEMHNLTILLPSNFTVDCSVHGSCDGGKNTVETQVKNARGVEVEHDGDVVQPWQTFEEVEKTLWTFFD